MAVGPDPRNALSLLPRAAQDGMSSSSFGSCRFGVDLVRMDFEEISQSIRALWEQKPGAVLLLILGFLVFVFLVVDTWIHKQRRRKARRH